MESLRREEILAEFRHLNRTLRWEGEILEERPRFTMRWMDRGEELMVTAFALDEANADGAIRAVIDEVERKAGRFEWKLFSFDEPTDLGERLAAAGLEIGAQEAIVVYDLAEGFTPFEQALSIPVVRVETERQLADFRAAAEEIFGIDYSSTTERLAEAIRAGDLGHRAYIAYVDGEAASVGRLYTDPSSPFAGLYGGGTRPAFRGRGLYRAVVSVRARDAARAGARYLQVDALPTSRPILLRLGFAHLADTWPCTLPG